MKKLLAKATIALSLVFVLICSVANAATYYVAKNGKNSYIGSEANPWATPNYAIKQLSAGDTLNIKAGTYSSVYVSGLNGTSGNVITIQNYNSEQVIIDRYPAETQNYSVRLVDCSYIVFDDLEFTDSDPDWDTAKTKDVTVQADRDWLVANLPQGDNFRLQKCSNVTIQNCEFYHNKNAGILATTPTPNANSNLQILNNIIHTGISTMSSYGIYINGNNHIIRGNTIYDCTGLGIKLGTQTQDCNNATVEKNIIYDFGGNKWYHSGVQAGYLIGGAGVYIEYGTGNTIQNNIVYQTPSYKSTYTEDDQSDGLRVARDNQIAVNNTIYNMVDIGLRIHGSGSTGIVAVNNILYNNRRNIGYTAGATEGAQTALTNNLTTNPSFVDAANGDFSLLKGSAAIDQGTATNAPSDDIVGNPRPVDEDDIEGAQYDIGAYEYVTGGGSDLSAPAGFKIL